MRRTFLTLLVMLVAMAANAAIDYAYLLFYNKDGLPLEYPMGKIDIAETNTVWSCAVEFQTGDQISIKSEDVENNEQMFYDISGVFNPDEGIFELNTTCIDQPLGLNPDSSVIFLQVQLDGIYYVTVNFDKLTMTVSEFKDEYFLRGSIVSGDGSIHKTVLPLYDYNAVGIVKTIYPGEFWLEKRDADGAEYLYGAISETESKIDVSNCRSFLCGYGSSIHWQSSLVGRYTVKYDLFANRINLLPTEISEVPENIENEFEVFGNIFGSGDNKEWESKKMRYDSATGTWSLRSDVKPGSFAIQRHEGETFNIIDFYTAPQSGTVISDDNAGTALDAVRGYGNAWENSVKGFYEIVFDPENKALKVSKINEVFGIYGNIFDGSTYEYKEFNYNEGLNKYVLTAEIIGNSDPSKATVFHIRGRNVDTDKVMRYFFSTNSDNNYFVNIGVFSDYTGNIVNEQTSPLGANFKNEYTGLHIFTFDPETKTLELYAGEIHLGTKSAYEAGKGFNFDEFAYLGKDENEYYSLASSVNITEETAIVAMAVYSDLDLALDFWAPSLSFVDEDNYNVWMDAISGATFDRYIQGVKVEFDLEKSKIRLTPDNSGVEEIENAVEGEVIPEYYNLQGIRLPEPPQSGIYIVRRGNEVTKEIVR